MFPANTWIFIAQGTDKTANTQYGFRYRPQSVSQQTIFYKTRSLSAAYEVPPSCTAFWGGDLHNPSFGQTVSYVRYFHDYVPNSQDQMINLAMMSPGCRHP